MNHSKLFLQLVNEAKVAIRETSPDQVSTWLEKGHDFHLIDVREDREWQKSRIPQAIHMGRGILERDIEAKIPDLNRHVVLYCGGGFRSALSAESLHKMGYKQVYSMAGGIRQWREQGLPLEESEPAG